MNYPEIVKKTYYVKCLLCGKTIHINASKHECPLRN